MADFDAAFDQVLDAEGGWQIVDVAGDRGGMTCAGLSRRAHPDWPGWTLVDGGAPATSAQIQALVRAEYRHGYWDTVHGDDIVDQDVATMIFSCVVLSGSRTAGRLAQAACGATVDGFVGRATLEKLNGLTPVPPMEGFALRFALARILRYVSICARDPSQRKFFFGWVRRALGER